MSSTAEVAQPNCGLCFIIKTTYGGNALIFRWLPSLYYIINTWMWQCQTICNTCCACSLRKGFNRSICGMKEQKARLQCLASAMTKFAMPSGAKMRKVCKEAKRKNLAVLAKTSLLNWFFFKNLWSSNVKAVVLTRAPDNAGRYHDISFEALFTQRGWPYWHVIFQVFLFVISGFVVLGFNVVSCRVTL